MKLLENISCKKGITLNAQLVDLLSILDEEISREEQDKKIVNYIESLRDRESKYEEATTKGNGARYLFLVNQVIGSLKGISLEEIERLTEIYSKSLPDLSICNKEVMIERLEEEGFDKSIYEKIAKDFKNVDFTSKEGILSLTPEDVRALYSHMFENGNRYDRVTFDNVGKYSGYVSFDGETYTPEKMDKMMKFCERHGVATKVNTLMFYADFPNIYESSLDIRVARGEISEQDKKDILKQSLIDYAKHLGKRYGDRIETIDIFNELIYDPRMIEKREVFGEYELDDNGNMLLDENGEPQPKGKYEARKSGWQKYLSLEDLCEMALVARKEMPNAVFTYNDVNWIEPEKRKEIIKIVKEIQKIEQRYREEGKLGPDEKGLIDTIGVEAHLGTDIDLDEIDAIFDDIQDEIGLPVEITEFDVGRDDEKPLAKCEILKQGMIFEKFMKLVQQRPEIISFTIWSQSDELSFMNYKNKEEIYKCVYASVLDNNFEEKEFEPSKEFEPQSFNYHTHTALCGHADGEMREYIEKAISSGMTVLGFSDHTPKALGKSDPHHEMSTSDFLGKYVPALLDLKEEYKDKIDIKIGLEAEYYGDEGEQYPQIKQFRKITEGKLDYMVLGQHTALARNDDGSLVKPPKSALKTSSHYPLDYAYTVVEAIRSGKFAYIAHPDIFLESRDKVPEDEKERYMENILKASEMICEAAKEHQIPLEINLGAIAAVEAGEKAKLADGSYPYPVPIFWEIAQEKGCQVLIGVDAHTPEALIDRTNEKIAKKILESKGIVFEYLDSFEPKGIGKEGKQETRITSMDVGKAFGGRSVSGKDDAKSKLAADRNEIITDKKGPDFKDED